MTLTLRSLRWWPRRTFAVFDGQQQVADMSLRFSAGERGDIDIEGVRHRAYRRFVAGGFYLERDGQVVATAHEPFFNFRSVAIINYQNEEYLLSPDKGKEFVLRQAGQQVGALLLPGPCTFPPTWPLRLCVFAMWLMIVLDQRVRQPSG
jgi:hypothetical protein